MQGTHPLKNDVFNYWSYFVTYCSLVQGSVKEFPVTFERPQEILSPPLRFLSQQNFMNEKEAPSGEWIVASAFGGFHHGIKTSR